LYLLLLFLGVKENSLREYGAVSAEVAREMAQGVRECFNTDIGVSTTGIAGPKVLKSPSGFLNEKKPISNICSTKIPS